MFILFFSFKIPYTKSYMFLWYNVLVSRGSVLHLPLLLSYMCLYYTQHSTSHHFTNHPYDLTKWANKTN